MNTNGFKKSPWKGSLVLVILLLVLPGCLDIWITTQIRADGSILQTIVFQGDSTEIADAPFACMNEGDWKKEWTKPEKDKHKLAISKEFRSVSELNETMNPADSNLLVIRVNATLQKKFRWFFTRFVYEETVLQANPFNYLDYKDYLTDDEIRMIAKDEDAREKEPDYDSIRYKTAEKHFEEYILRSMYEGFYQQLLNTLAEDKSFTLHREQLDSHKEKIYRFLIDSVKGSETGEILGGIIRVVDHPDLRLIRSEHLTRFEPFQSKMKFYEMTSDDNYNFTIRMPGLLLQTNSTEIKGSDLAWDVDYYDFFFKDFTMTAESRTVNTWAFIVAGLLLLVAIGTVIAGLLKKK